ncbi:RNA polymerase alpha subunit C-terminal domain-containing protein [Niabella terrae]
MGKRLHICPQGHRYYKSSDCEVCPRCASEKNKSFFVAVPAPARRALESAGIREPAALAQFSEAELLSLHGLGKHSLPILKKALEQVGLQLKK